MASWSTGRMLSSLSPPVKVLMLFWKMDYLSWFCVESKALELSVPEERRGRGVPFCKLREDMG